MDYLLHHPSENVNLPAFEAACGVGVTVTADEIEETVSTVLLKVVSSSLNIIYFTLHIC